MTTVCQQDKCTGCMACIDICPKDAIHIKDSLSAYNAAIDTDKCIHCNLCHNICQNNNTIEFTSPLKWFQGWALDETIREKGSSGGLASALMISFIENGGYVCSCLYKDGKFIFLVTNNKPDIFTFSGSKYIKSNPIGIYKEIKKLLLQKEKVLFIGLPCQVSAVKLDVGKELSEQLFTIDLICHGTPSPQLLDEFLAQYNLTTRDLKDIRFRIKLKFGITDGLNSIDTKNFIDSYLISFLKGLNYTENCYLCQYAKFDRVSDLTLGDSWGSNLPGEEINKGISLILCQTKKGMHLIEQTQLKLFDVNIENAFIRNRQLKEPSAKPPKRDEFFKAIDTKCKYNKVVYKIYPQKIFIRKIKNLIKNFLIKLHLYKKK